MSKTVKRKRLYKEEVFIMRRQVLSLLVENNPGVTSHISGLFSRRGYNIDSFSSGVTADPRYTRITIVASGDEQILEQISEQLAKVLKQLISVKKEDVSVLIVGLGNRAVTPDALGPRVVDNLYITRHIINEYGKYAFGKEHVNRVSSIVPGVMAQTGMESMEIVNGIVKETKPDVVIAIDALAARNTKRLNRTIQVTDTGINPGSGVGNHRHGLNEKSIGVPVIAIGVPTVTR